MESSRHDPHPPAATPEGILLLRALGDLLHAGDATTVEARALSATMGREVATVAALIGRGRAAGLVESQGGAVWLTWQGELWYRWDRRRR